MHELWWDPVNGWHYNQLKSAALGSPLAFTPAAAFVDDERGTRNVYYVSDTHDIIELLWMPYLSVP